MSLLKSVVAIVNAHIKNNAVDSKKITPYDPAVTGITYNRSDELAVKIKKCPLRHYEVTIMHKKGIRLSVMVHTPRAYTNCQAAYDNGYFDDHIKKLEQDVSTYININSK